MKLVRVSGVLALLCCALGSAAQAQDHEIYVLNQEHLAAVKQGVSTTVYADFRAATLTIPVEDKQVFVFSPDKVPDIKERHALTMKLETLCPKCSFDPNDGGEIYAELPPSDAPPKPRWCIDPKTGKAYRCKDGQP